MADTATPLSLIEDIPDADVIAEAVIRDRKRRRKSAPSKVDLAAAITNIRIVDTIQGASTLEIEIADQDFRLMDSGFFDANADGRLDAVDLNYPDESRFWWRLTQVRPSASQQVTLVFMERAAVHLMAHKGPEKASRGKVTRAQFIGGLVAKVGKSKNKGVPRIKFVSKELKVKQQVEGTKAPKAKTDKERKDAKDPGINTDEKLEGKEGTLRASQIRVAEEMLDEASTLDAPEKAVLALVIAGLVEAPDFKNPTSGGAGGAYAGPLQYHAERFGMENARSPSWAANHFLTKGATGRGGAIKFANQGMSPAEIINTIHNPGGQHFYEGEDLKRKAEKIIEAYGAGGFGGTTYFKQYNFTVGTPENPRETYWAAIQRMAEEVKWPFFIDGQFAYFDSEMTLIKQKPAALIHRDDPAVVDWSYTWDGRMIATEMTMDLIMEPFQFRAGEVVKLEGFGPASTGSTATTNGKKTPLPGRWLISEIERDRFRLYSVVTLKQPVEEELEPAPEQGTRDDTSGGSGTGGNIQEIAKKFTGSYLYGGGHGPKLSSIDFGDRLDCSSSTSKLLKEAGYFDPDVAWVSGMFASSWGEPGEGSEFTVYANGGHVFVQGDGWRFDTGGPGGGNGPRYHGVTRPTGGFTARKPPGNPGKGND